MSEKEFLAEELKALLPPNAVIVSGDEYSKLKKEVEELKRPLGNSAHPIEDRLIEQAKQESKNWKNPECFIGGFGWGCSAAAQLKDQELTRLRELLGKCKPILESDKIYNIDSADLIAEIDNALNHKP